jgi:iron complex transport system ATP-binding protein
MKIEIKNAALGYGKDNILSGVNFEMREGEVVCLLGPNGAGKTTLFKTLLGFLKPLAGEILIDGQSVQNWGNSEFARKIAYVPQTHSTPFPYSVFQVVLFGRASHLGLFGSPGKKDRQIAEKCIEMLGIGHLKHRSFTQLSGGERQLTVIARALAQEPAFLVMDEPTSNLDFGNQVKVLKKINELRDESLGIFIATHSPDHAFLLNAKVLMVCSGKLQCYGEPAEIITETNMKQVYGVDVRVIGAYNDSGFDRNVCLPMI